MFVDFVIIDQNVLSPCDTVSFSPSDPEINGLPLLSRMDVWTKFEEG